MMEGLVSQGGQAPDFLRSNIPLFFLGVTFLLYVLDFFSRRTGEVQTRTKRSWFFALLNMALFIGLACYVYAVYKLGAVLIFIVIVVTARFALKVLSSVLFLLYAVFLPGGVLWFAYDKLTHNALSDKVYSAMCSLNSNLIAGVSGLIVLKSFLPVLSFLSARHKPDYRFWGWVGGEAFSVVCAVYAFSAKKWMPVLAAFTVSTVINIIFGDPHKNK